MGSINNIATAQEGAKLLNASADLVASTEAYVTIYFHNPKFDASHNIHHVLRVRDNALLILEKEKSVRSSKSLPELSPLLVVLGAWMHDVDDHKYRDVSHQKAPGDEPEVVRVLKEFGASEELALTVYTIAEGVSYSSEIKDPEKVSRLIQQIPELAVVQDADRLDAMGAIGIGRCFAYGGAKTVRSLEDSIQHFEDKLLKLEGMMKTETGRSMAKNRSQRVREFLKWWREEAGPLRSIEP